MSERTQEMERILEESQKHIEKIREYNATIKDKTITAKLKRMEKLVSTIFYEVDINPNQADNLGMFLNYYLPTTEKLLKAYTELDEKTIKGRKAQKTKKEIDGALEALNSSFEGILDKFYQEQEMEINSDISALSVMMRQEGLL
jgi:5-bromo-4-chloroindolyl phosphate hydrolysis protein